MITRIVKPAKKKRKTGWGGKRPKTGRPPKYNQAVIRKTVNFPKSMADVIQFSCLKENLSFSEVIVKLVKKGMKVSSRKKTRQGSGS